MNLLQIINACDTHSNIKTAGTTEDGNKSEKEEYKVNESEATEAGA